MVLSDLAVGSYVQDPDTKYNGTVIVWRILEHGHSGDPEGSTALESRDIISTKAFDATEPSNPDTYISQYGNSQYKYSNILQWLNSDEDNWYSPQHTYDEAPSDPYVSYANPYVNEPGFLTNVSTPLKNALLTTTKKVSVGSYGSNIENVSSKIFLLSRGEVYSDTYFEEGDEPYRCYYSLTAYDIRRKSYLNEAAKGEFPSEASYNWWVRSPASASYNHYCNSGATENADYSSEYSYKSASCGGIVPAFCISSNTRVNPTPVQNVYTLELKPAVKQIYIGDSSNHAVPIL